LVLPRLSRSANHGLLWFGTAALIAASGAGGRPRARRAALRGVTSLALASAAANVFAKRAVRRARPLPDAVPILRQPHSPPFTSSFPSGHTASAAAFATGVALESRSLGAAVAPLAAAVAFARVYTGAHYPGDVLAGAALGAAAAYTVRRMMPPPALLPPRQAARAPAPALPGGEGLVLVTNARSGAAAGRGPDLATLLPRAEILGYGDDGVSDDGDTGGGGGGETLPELLDRAARLAVERDGALGVFGGDGTVSAGARTARRYGLPLAVLPGGTFNHFAHDLGVHTPADARDALTAGEAVWVDLARFSGAAATGTADAADCTDCTAEESGVFINTFSIGVYPELVRLRERWAPRIGSWPAGVLAAWQVLRTCAPVRVWINGRSHRLWLLFAGNCRYRGAGLGAQRRDRLTDGLLDVRVARAGHWARTRLLAAGLTGTLYRTPVHGASLLTRLRIDRIEPATILAYDGEVTDAPRRLLLDKERAALRVYGPAAAPEPAA
jgi:undecaprenyl-diphosphatase